MPSKDPFSQFMKKAEKELEEKKVEVEEEVLGVVPETALGETLEHNDPRLDKFIEHVFVPFMDMMLKQNGLMYKRSSFKDMIKETIES